MTYYHLSYRDETCFVNGTSVRVARAIANFGHPTTLYGVMLLYLLGKRQLLAFSMNYLCNFKPIYFILGVNEYSWLLYCVI